MEDYFRKLLQDIAIDLSDEFDQNFERKAFFGKKWDKTKFQNRRGSLMLRTGALRRSIQHRIAQNSIRWTSSQPYAGIHNEGGEITVTAKMKKFFWAMYFKNGKTTPEGEQFKAMAMKKIGSKIIMPERKFIGDDPAVEQSIKKNADALFLEIDRLLITRLRQR